MELYIEPEIPKYNRLNGQFLKGHEPHNKGKKWSEWMDGRKAKKVLRIAKRNLKGRADFGGWNKKPIVAIKGDVFYGVFSSCIEASEKMKLQRRNISHVVNGNRKTCGGYKFFFESDFEKWSKIITK
jgi:hypothetical protein